MATVRTFIAVNLDGSLYSPLTNIIERLASSKASVKWVAAQNTHLTLKFLGNVEEARLAEVFAACERAATGSKPIDLELKAVGCFPDMQRPRVIWVGIEEGAEPVKKLQSKVENELARIGFPKEKRRFRAHLTIGRVKGEGGISKLRRILEEEKDIHIGSMRAKTISVMKSKTLPTGPVYTELRAIPLQ